MPQPVVSPALDQRQPQESQAQLGLEWAQQNAKKNANYDPMPGLRKLQAEDSPDYVGTLGRELKTLGGNIAGIPSIAYHAAMDPVTPEERARYGASADLGLGPVGRFVDRTAIQPAMNAAEWYTNAARGRIPNAYEQALDVAPEAIGTGAAGALTEKIANPLRGSSISAETAPVRGGIRGINAGLRNTSPLVGGAIGGKIGASSGIPHGYELGWALGSQIPKIQIPGETIGLPRRITGGPAIAPTLEEFSSEPAIGRAASQETGGIQAGISPPPRMVPAEQIAASTQGSQTTTQPASGSIPHTTPRGIENPTPESVVPARRSIEDAWEQEFNRSIEQGMRQKNRPISRGPSKAEYEAIQHIEPQVEGTPRPQAPTDLEQQLRQSVEQARQRRQ